MLVPRRVTFNYKEPFVRNNNQEFMVHHGDFRNSTAVVVASHLNFKGCQILCWKLQTKDPLFKNHSKNPLFFGGHKQICI